jgi:hypothetical protein
MTLPHRLHTSRKQHPILAARRTIDTIATARPAAEADVRDTE